MVIHPCKKLELLENFWRQSSDLGDDLYLEYEEGTDWHLAYRAATVGMTPIGACHGPT